MPSKSKTQWGNGFRVVQISSFYKMQHRFFKPHPRPDQTNNARGLKFCMRPWLCIKNVLSEAIFKIRPLRRDMGGTRG